MPRTISYTDAYHVPPSAILAMLRRPDYFEEKLIFMQDVSSDILRHEITAGGLEFEVERVTRAKMPEIARRGLGENRLLQRESWVADGDALIAHVHVDITGQPAGATGQMRVSPAAHGADWFLDFAIRAKVPLVGGMIEGWVANEFREGFGRELEFNTRWLAEH